jgi:hypothetical protein
MKRKVKRKKRLPASPKPPINLEKSSSISLFAHILVLWIAFGMPTGCNSGKCGSGSGDHKGGGVASHDDRGIKEKKLDPIKVEISNRHIEKGGEQKAYEAAQKKHEECKPFFGGIGITYAVYDETILNVYKYYPAWSVGLMIGDHITMEDYLKIKGEVGTELTLPYVRDGVKYEVTIRRGRICLEDSIKEQKQLEKGKL